MVNDHKDVEIHADSDVGLTTIVVIQAVFLGSQINQFQ
jgi:hypothetical protein